MNPNQPTTDLKPGERFYLREAVKGMAVLARFLKDIGVLDPDEGEVRVAPTPGA